MVSYVFDDYQNSYCKILGLINQAYQIKWGILSNGQRSSFLYILWCTSLQCMELDVLIYGKRLNLGLHMHG